VIPSKPDDGNWLEWVNRNYPFANDWQQHLLTRIERPRPGSDEQLDDLRGINDRFAAAELAKIWFYSTENSGDIAKNLIADRERENEKDRKRLIRVAKLALDGKLGESRDERDNAQATAQTYIQNAPENCTYDDLRDWEKMHQYAKRITNGERVERPRLAADIRREKEQARSLADMHETIGAAQANRPKAEQRQFGDGW
jgi:hypothetical protein